MNKSISTRYFRTTAFLLVTSITFLGVVLMYFCVGYFRAESENTLLTSVRSLRDSFSTFSVEKLEKLETLRSAPNASQAVEVVANATGSIVLLTVHLGHHGGGEHQPDREHQNTQPHLFRRRIRRAG